MSEDESFLRRWSRRKHAAVVRAPQPDPAPAAEPEESLAPAGERPPPEPAVDLSALPPVDSIGAQTDIRGFLQKGVPLDLTRAALRRAWSEDPAIRDFIEVAENQWDFATGSDIPGFGPLDAGTDVRSMVADIMGDTAEREVAAAKQVEPAANAPARASAPVAREDSGAATASAAPSNAGDAGALETPAAPDGGSDTAGAENDAVQQVANDHVGEGSRGRGRHGGALPQ